MKVSDPKCYRYVDLEKANNGWATLAPGVGQFAVTHSGYILVYIDNQSIGNDVWFDNVHVEHYTSKVLEEDMYYPFGLTISEDAGVVTTTQPYKYQGILLNKDFNLETYEAKYRDLDPQIGRFRQIDPKAEFDYSISTYASMRNNPIMYFDPFGDAASTHTDENGNVLVVYNDNDLGVYKHENNPDGSKPTKAQIDKQHKKSTSAGGTKMGETEYWNEFVNFNTGRPEGRIIFSSDPRESWDQLIKWGQNKAKRIGIFETKNQSQLYGSLDIKNNKDWAPYGVMTGRLYKGKFMTARSAGNYLAGYNGVTVPIPYKNIFGSPYLRPIQYMKLAGAYQVLKSLSKTTAIDILINGKSYGPPPYYGEEPYSGRMIWQGMNDGVKSVK